MRAGLLVFVVFTGFLNFAEACGSTYCTGIRFNGYVRTRAGTPISGATLGNPSNTYFGRTNSSGYYDVFSDGYSYDCYSGCSTYDIYTICASAPGYYEKCTSSYRNATIDFTLEEVTNPSLPVGACKIEDARFVSDTGGCKDVARSTIWTLVSSTKQTWANANAACENLVRGGVDDWKLPSDQQLIELTASSGWVTNFNFSTNSDFWSRTEYEYIPATYAYAVNLKSRNRKLYAKSIQNSVICSRIPVGPAPTVSLSAFPSQVYTGGTPLLTWSSTNASSCSLKKGTTVVSNLTSGSIAGPAVFSPTTFTLTCNGGGGSASTAVTVTTSSKLCGYIYNKPSYGGTRLTFSPGEFAALPASWENLVGSVMPSYGCRIQLYENAGFGGATHTATAATGTLPVSVNGKVSSFKCLCN